MTDNGTNWLGDSFREIERLQAESVQEHELNRVLTDQLLEQRAEIARLLLDDYMGSPPDDVEIDTPRMQLRREMQLCDHPVQAIRSGRDKGDRTSNWCGWCEEVGQLQAEIARLREVLQPFARVAPLVTAIAGMNPSRVFLWSQTSNRPEDESPLGITLADCQKAEATLSTPADEPKCGTCGGTSEVDSGAPDPQGNFISIRCPECTQSTGDWLERHDAEVARLREWSSAWKRSAKVWRDDALLINPPPVRTNCMIVEFDWLSQHDAEVRQKHLQHLCVPDLIMGAKEYAFTPLKGWHAVCRDYEGIGNVAVKYFGDATTIREGEDE